MAKEYLKPIYKDVFGNSFNPSSFDDRMEMQKLVYILQEAGVSIGEYDFLWYKHGPYCQGLQNDILDVSHVDDVVIRYSQDAKEVINRVKDVFCMETQYKRSAWVECIASLRYLKACILTVGSSDETVISELMRRKPHLHDYNLNMEALRLVDYIIG